MPQVDLKGTLDITIDYGVLFDAIENTLQQVDPSSGQCKCRAYSAEARLYSHVLLEVRLLQKPHRDK